MTINPSMLCFSIKVKAFKLDATKDQYLTTLFICDGFENTAFDKSNSIRCTKLRK